MNRFLTWLLDLEGDLLNADAPLTVEWELPVPAWFLLGMALLSAAGIVLLYGRERVSMTRRVILIVLRLGLIAVILAALCRPSVVLQRNRVEPAYVILLVDRSLSMSGKDYYDPDTREVLANTFAASDAQRVDDMTRLEIARAALTHNGHAALDRLLVQNGIQLVTFAAGAEPLSLVPKGASAEELDQALHNIVADGQATSLSAPLDFILNRMQGRRVAAIVLASDGRMTSTVQLDGLLQQAVDKQIPIHPIRLGSTHKEMDVEVTSVKAQSVVFANDFLLVEAAIRARGLDRPVLCTVQLVDDQTDEVAHELQVSLDPSVEAITVELTAKLVREGDARYRVQVTPLPDERQLENNAEIVETRVLIDRLKVLYVEGYPRFEYRFLKNALLREKSIELSVLLLEADEQFVQEGAESIRAFPQTPEELARYQVVLFGDVDPNGEWLTADQMAMLLEFVGDKGGGFGLIAGERHSPHSFLGTPLERLIPVKIDPQIAALSSDEALTTGFRPLLTEAGQDSRIMRFFADPADNEATVRGLPELYWISRSLGSKPGAAVLLVDPDMNTAAGPMPVIVQGRYGAGKLFFQATDDTWRWRRHTGELLYDGYWVRVMRELMNPSLASADRGHVIRTDRRVYPYGASVRAQVEILDPRLISEELASLALHVSRPGAPGSRETLQPASAERQLQLQRVGPHSNVFEGTFLPAGSGSFTVTVPELSSPGGRNPSATFRVEKPDLELRHPDADHQMLERIAATTGGKMLEPGQLEFQFAEIRDRSVQIPDDITESLWDSRLVFVLFVLMISIEWGLRKVFGLI